MGDSSESIGSSPRDTAMAPPLLYDGVGVAVRVRPFSTIERADPSIHNGVQCVKDCVVIGTSSCPTRKVTAPAALSGAPRAIHGVPTAVPPAKPASTTATARLQQFQVDRIFHPHSSQIEVYEESCRHIVEGVFQGINGSILAYGATGSGKTHTMFGSAMSAAGIVYQAAQDIFSEKSRLEEEEEKTVTVQCSFLEIYNEEVFDLLSPAEVSEDAGADHGSPKGGGGGGGGPFNASKGGSSGSNSGSNGNVGGSARQPKGRAAAKRSRVPLQVREASKEDKESQVNPDSLFVCGLHCVYPQSVDDFARLIEVGHMNRFVAATGANAQSSRSHAIITMQVTVTNEASGGKEGTVARIRFCDLAGSERAAATSNVGVRLREGGSINRSLLALGAVVQSLVQRKRHPGKQVFVPYRGSKLTRLLRDGIGGNCRTQMLFCLSPSTRHYEESVNTMLFAMQAKEIRVAAGRNEYSVNSAVLAKNQEQVIEELRAELAAARNELMRLGALPLTLNSSSLGEGVRRSDESPQDCVGAKGNNNNNNNNNASVQSADSLAAIAISPLASSGYASGFPRSLDLSAFPGTSSFDHQAATPSAAVAPAAPLDSNQPHTALYECGDGQGTKRYSLSLNSAISATGKESGGCPSSPALFGTPPPPTPSSITNASPSPCAHQQQQHLGALSASPRAGSCEFDQGTALSLLVATPSLASSGPDAPPSALRKPSTSVSRPARPSVFQEGTRMFSELESKLKSFTAEKESLYHQMRDAEERQQDRDIKIRERKWKLAQFLASNAMSSRARGMHGGVPELTSGGTPVTPIGVAGLRQLIAEMEAESESQDEKVVELSAKLDSIDTQIAATRQELLREKQQPSLELLLDNAKLRQNCTEAECLAAHYHQACRTISNRQQEYAQALQICVDAIRAAMPLLPFTSPQREQAKVALLYASLPTAGTADMIAAFEDSLRVEATPPLAPHVASPSSSEGGPLHPMATLLPPMVPVSPKKGLFSAQAHYRSGGVGGGTHGGQDEPRTPPRLTTVGEPEAAGGEVNLERHYQELVEAASCFKNLSPTCGRGRRNQTPTRSQPADEEAFTKALAEMQSGDQPRDELVPSNDADGTLTEDHHLHHDHNNHQSRSSSRSSSNTDSGGASPHEKGACANNNNNSSSSAPSSGAVRERGHRLAPPRSGGTVRAASKNGRKRLSPYARTYSTSSFNAASTSQSGGGGGGGGGSGSNRRHRSAKDRADSNRRRSSRNKQTTAGPLPVGSTGPVTPTDASSASAQTGRKAANPRGESPFANASPLGGCLSPHGGADTPGREERFHRVRTDTNLATASPLPKAAAGSSSNSDLHPSALPEGGGSGSGSGAPKGKRGGGATFAPAKGAAAGEAGGPSLGGNNRPRSTNTAAHAGKNSNGSANPSGKRKAVDEPLHVPVTTPLPKNQRPHIFVRSNTAFALRAGQLLLPNSKAAAANGGPTSTSAASSPLSGLVPGGGGGGGMAAPASPPAVTAVVVGPTTAAGKRNPKGKSNSGSGRKRTSPGSAGVADGDSGGRHTDPNGSQGHDERRYSGSGEGSSSRSNSHVASPTKSPFRRRQSRDDDKENHGAAHAVPASTPSHLLQYLETSAAEMGKRAAAAAATAATFRPFAYAADAAHCVSPLSTQRSAVLSEVSSTTITPSKLRKNLRKGSAVSTLTSDTLPSCEDDLLVSRSTCPEGLVPDC